MDDAVPRAHPFGWPKKIRKADDFSSVFRLRAGPGFRCRGDCLEILAGPNKLGWARLGLIVSKRILPRAVDRNRVKRQIREAFRLVQHELGGLDTIVRLVGLAGIGDPQDRALLKGGVRGGVRSECDRLLQEIRTLSAR